MDYFKLLYYISRIFLLAPFHVHFVTLRVEKSKISVVIYIVLSILILLFIPYANYIIYFAGIKLNKFQVLSQCAFFIILFGTVTMAIWFAVFNVDKIMFIVEVFMLINHKLKEIDKNNNNFYNNHKSRFTRVIFVNFILNFIVIILNVIDLKMMPSGTYSYFIYILIGFPLTWIPYIIVGVFIHQFEMILEFIFIHFKIINNLIERSFIGSNHTIQYQVKLITEISKIHFKLTNIIKCLNQYFSFPIVLLLIFVMCANVMQSFTVFLDGTRPPEDVLDIPNMAVKYFWGIIRLIQLSILMNVTSRVMSKVSIFDYNQLI